MSKKTTMQDIANYLNISRMTVSKSFNDDTDIPNETKERVFEAAKLLGYKYIGSNPLQILVLIPEIYFTETEAFYSAIYKKLNEKANNKNVLLYLKIVSQYEMKNNLINIEDEKKDGIILLGQFELAYVYKILDLKIPTVCVDFYYDELEIDSVVSNNINSAYVATKYLIKQGHKNIEFLGTINSSLSIMDRYIGYYKAMIEHGMELDKLNVISDRDENGHIIDFDLPNNKTTAVVCNNDHSAYLLINKLKESNISVPNDISIIGFDDVLYSTISNPQITTMRVSRGYMASEALKLIMRRIKEKNAKRINMTLECEMVIRDSTIIIK